MASQRLKLCFHLIGPTGMFCTGRGATFRGLVCIWSMTWSIWKSKSSLIDKSCAYTQVFKGEIRLADCDQFCSDWSRVCHTGERKTGHRPQQEGDSLRA